METADVSDTRTKTVSQISEGIRFFRPCTDRTLIRAEEGLKVLHASLTAHMVQSISTIAVAVDTLGG